MPIPTAPPPSPRRPAASGRGPPEFSICSRRRATSGASLAWDADDRVLETAEKRRISDWASTGLYYFRRGSDFVRHAQAMIDANDRSGNEFYVAPIYNRLIAAGQDVRGNRVDEVWVLGNPAGSGSLRAGVPAVNSPQPRHVLHVLNAAGGGAAPSTIGLIESLRERGIESSAVCHDSGSPSEREQLHAAARGRVLFTPLYWWNHKIRLPAWKRPLSELRQLWRTGWKRRSTARVVEFARRHEVDLIHSNTILTLEGGFAARQLGLPHVWHVRELVGPGHPFRLPCRGARARAISPDTCSKGHRQFAGDGRGHPVLVAAGIARGGPQRHRCFPVRASPAHAVDRPLVVAMVGSLTSRWKNHLLLVRAAGLVDRALPIEWRIYGHDPSQGGQFGRDEYVNRLLAEVRAAGLADRFQLAGFHPDPAEIMAQVDLLVHPAESESFGRVIVEGMAAGLPVVGVAAGGVGEIVRHEETGLLAPPGAADVMARYITTLVRDAELRKRYGAAGCRRAHECYSLQASVEGVIRIYRAAMAAAAASGAAANWPAPLHRPRPTTRFRSRLMAPFQAGGLRSYRRLAASFLAKVVSRA